MSSASTTTPASRGSGCATLASGPGPAERGRLACLAGWRWRGPPAAAGTFRRSGPGLPPRNAGAGSSSQLSGGQRAEALAADASGRASARHIDDERGPLAVRPSPAYERRELGVLAAHIDQPQWAGDQPWTLLGKVAADLPPRRPAARRPLRRRPREQPAVGGHATARRAHPVEQWVADVRGRSAVPSVID